MDNRADQATTMEGNSSEDGNRALENAVVDAMVEYGEGTGASPKRVIEKVGNDQSASQDSIEEAINFALNRGRCYEWQGALISVEGDEEIESADDGSPEPSWKQPEDRSINLEEVRRYFDEGTEDFTPGTVISLLSSLESFYYDDVESGIVDLIAEELRSVIQQSSWDDSTSESFLAVIDLAKEKRKVEKKAEKAKARANWREYQLIKEGKLEMDSMPIPDWVAEQEGSGPSDPSLEFENEPDQDDDESILEDRDGVQQPVFPGQLSGESIHLQNDDEEEWHDPRTLY